jgi:NADH-quinone oxidoreductase subunit N
MNAAPLFILALAIAALLAIICIKRSHLLATATALLGLAAAMASIPFALGAPPAMPAVFALNAAALGFMFIILAAAAVILVIGYGYWQKSLGPREEFPLLLLIATLGACALAASAGFIALFLGLETMTLAMIGMIAYPRDRAQAEEAGLKYLILSGMSSGFLLFGLGLIELATGSLSFANVLGAPADPILLAGLAMIGVGAGFKLSVVPFHFWVPDVYAGAPTPAGAYLAVIPKLAVLAVLIRLQSFGIALSSSIFHAVTIIAILSMLIGNLLALLQENFKRILGYSSIAHLGYLLVAWLPAWGLPAGGLPAWGLAAGTVARNAVLFYLVTYAITMAGAFGVIAAISSPDARRDADRVQDLRGMFWTRPALAAVLTLVLLSLAGIPPAIGFIAKMYIFAAGIHTDLWLLIGTMVASSVIGLFYYLNIIIVMAQRPESAAVTPAGIAWSSRAAMAGLGALVVGLGVAPQPLIAMLRWMFP